MQKTYHREEKDKKKQRVCSENTKTVYSDVEKIMKYKEINPYKRRSKPKKGNLISY